MKPNRSLQQWLSSAVLGLALTAAPGVGLAANIVYTFDSDVQGWYADSGNGTVAWDGTHGRGGNGCLKYTIPAGTSECDPRVAVNFDTTTAFSLECDILVDPVSGTDGNGSYGNLQLVARDSGGSWDSMWYGDMGSAGGKFGTWHHVKRAFTSNYGAKASLQFQIASGSGTYSSDVIVYIDNVVIQDGTPGLKPAFADFAWPEEVTEGMGSWTGGGASSIALSQDTSAAPLHPDGSLKMVVNFADPNGGWEEGDAQYAPYDFDPSKFTYVDFDLYLDAPTGLSTYGIFQIFQINPSWGWTWLAGPGLSAANIGTWTHFSIPLVISDTVAHGLIFQVGGGMTSTFTYYVDNITVWKKAGPPTIKSMRFEGSPTGQGAELTMNAKNNAYQREAICVPGGSPDYSWVGRTPISYSFTITNFPDAVKHAGYEAHLFLVNESTIPSAGNWNETYGGCDWNAADLLKFTVENSAGGGIITRLSWKTNTPGANPPAANEVFRADLPTTALGKWSINFESDTTGTVTGPGGFTTNFTLPQGLATQFDPYNAAALSFLQFGMGQNDGQANNHNYNASGVFSEISMNGGLYAFDETFPGPALNSSGLSWRSTSSTAAVEWVPAGTALWLTWTTPADGYSVQVSPNLKTWSDAAVTYTYPSADTQVGAVPAASIPGGQAVFFRLTK